MSTTEKIKLILDVDGVQDVAALKTAMMDLADAMGVADAKFDEVDKKAKKASKALKDVGDTVGDSKKFDPKNLLYISQALDDVQYGIRGIVNNVPQLAQALGFGAAAAGGFQIAMIAINQAWPYLEKVFNGMKEKGVPTMKDLGTAFGALSVAAREFEKQIKEMDEQVPKSAEELNKYKATVEQLKVAKEGLAKATEAATLAEKNAKAEGALADEEKARTAKAFQEGIVDTGDYKGTEGDLRAALIGRQQEQANADIMASAREGWVDGKGFRNQFLKAAEKEMNERASNPLRAEAWMTQAERNNAMIADAKARAQQSISDGADFETKELLANVQGKGTQAEQAEAMKRLRELVPERAKVMDELLAHDKEELETAKKDARWREKHSEALKEKAETDAFIKQHDDELRRIADLEAKQAEKEGAVTAGQRNAVLNQVNPMAVAARRYAGARSDEDLRRQERRDIATWSNALQRQGMGHAEANEAAKESIEGGRKALEEMGKAMGLPMKSWQDYQRASMAAMQRLNAQAQRAMIETQYNTMMLQQMGLNPNMPRFQGRRGTN